MFYHFHSGEMITETRKYWCVFGGGGGGGGASPKCYGLGLGTELNMIIGTEWLQMLILQMIS